MKIYKYELCIKTKKIRPCEHLSGYFKAWGDMDANLFVYNFLKKKGVIKVLQCKISEVEINNPLEKIQWFDVEGSACNHPHLKEVQ